MCSDKTEINWRDIDTILLDMDGTVLDLAFDNYFWLEVLPQHIAQLRGISLSVAREKMQTHTARVHGTLQWYCIEHWSEQLDLDVAAIKHAIRHRIAYLPGALEFLQRARRVSRPGGAALRIVIVTNAHPRTLAIKLRQTHVNRYVDAIYSAHDFGHPKESAQFWSRFERAHALQRDRTVLIDDSASVVAAAKEHGLAGVVTITRPDSSQPPQANPGGPAVAALADLSDALVAG
jgi:HAD superfamily hydrolase (TIGR01509 family)